MPDSTLTLTSGDSERSVDNSDRIEIFLSCDPQMACYYGFEVDPSGKVMDYKNAYYRQFNFDWNGRVATAGNVFPAGYLSPAGYRVDASFGLDYLRELGVLQPDGTVLMGLFRADALPSGDIQWYTLLDPRTPEPDFHLPATLFPYRP